VENFVQATENDVHMCAKFGGLKLYGYLLIISSGFAFMEL
jgi:hypothetical protein